MKITKIGHCCLLIETAEHNIITDPGVFSVLPENLPQIHFIVVTHEHADHMHVPSVSALLAFSPKARIITNSAVALLLEKENISCEIVEGRMIKEYEGSTFEAFDARHEEIFENFGQVQNTGYFINEKLFYPGDAYAHPHKPVPVLALPVAGPWVKIAEVIRYALLVKPEKAFPVHDGMLNEFGISSHNAHCSRELSKNSIEFIPLRAGEQKEFF